MSLTPEIKASIDKTVLCWLATVSSENQPNVSPKEIFSYYRIDQIIIANIASPQSAKNIRANENVCISFIDILVQKGFKIKGIAKVVDQAHPDFLDMEKVLLKMTEGKFPFKTIISIIIKKVNPIIAPRYLFYPETTEEAQVQSAKAAYRI